MGCNSIDSESSAIALNNYCAINSLTSWTSSKCEWLICSGLVVQGYSAAVESQTQWTWYNHLFGHKRSVKILSTFRAVTCTVY